MSKVNKQYSEGLSGITSMQNTPRLKPTTRNTLDALYPRTQIGKFLLPMSASLVLASQTYGFGMQEIKINSYIGEPLHATVPLNLNGQANVKENCFRVINNASDAGVPVVDNIQTKLITRGNQTFLDIKTRSGIVEPMSELTIATNCSQLPRLERTYTVMLDPSTSLSDQSQRLAQSYTQETTTGTVVSFASNNTPNRTRTYTSPRFVAPTSPIEQGTNYTVTFGESLTEIATRVNGRESGSMWRMAAAIHAANPSAFFKGDPNHLEVGATITIPNVSNGFPFSEQQAQATLMNGSFSSVDTTYFVDNSTNSNVTSQTDIVDLGTLLTNASNSNNTNSIQADTNLARVSSSPSIISEAQLTTALPTFTMSMGLSALSLQRITARENGQILSEFIPDNSDLFGQPNDEQEIVKEAVLTANRESTSSTDIASSSSNDTATNTSAVNAVSNTNVEESSSWGWLAWLLSLVALGLAAWKLLIPYVQRRLRIWNIHRYRSHLRKNKFRRRQKERRRMIEESSSQLRRPSIDVGSIDPVDPDESAYTVNTEAKESSNSTGLFDPPQLTELKRDIERAETQLASMDFNEADLAASYEHEVLVDTATDESLETEFDLDMQEITETPDVSGPRKATVAKSVYDVEMIDDTGELASLTTAFPELEAELNARIGSEEMQEIRENLDTRISKTLEIDSSKLDLEENIKRLEDTGIGRSTQKLQPSIDIDFDDIDLLGKTQTLNIDGKELDLNIPGLLDDTASTEVDFESVAGEETLATQVFNEELFGDDTYTRPTLTDTFSTEGLDIDADTRVAEVLMDEDGLTPEDFGLSMDELSDDPADYSYLEDDASISTEALNIEFDELEELGMDDDDNIIPFDPNKKKQKTG